MTSILLPAEYFIKLDPSYQKCILELEKELNETLWYDNALKSEIIDKFSDKYLMPKEIWDKRIDLQSLDANDENPKAEYKQIKEKALTHFYSKRKHPLYFSDSKRKLLKSKFLPVEINQRDIEYCLTFPHWKLEECLREFDEFSDNPIPKYVLKRYEKVRELYDKIKLTENDLNQWLKYLLESEDDEFIIHNIEYRLGTDLTNKDLWKLYIQYLKDCEKYTDLINVYSKYCKFFLNDTEMLKEYENEINKQRITNIQKIEECVEPDKNATVFYSLRTCQLSLVENIYLQNFSLPTTFIRYILDNANAYTLFNIYQTCKYFYHIHPNPLCHKFCVQQQKSEDQIVFKGQSLDIFVKDFEPKSFKNFYISNNLQFYSTKNSSSLSNLINVLYRCDAKYLNIFGQDLTFDEFKFLAGHGNVKQIIFYNVKITNSNGSFISLEDILSFTPKIYHLRMRSTYVNLNPKTFDILSKTKFESKFEIFYISIASGETSDPNEFCEFLKKNLRKESKIGIKFQRSNPVYRSNFAKIITDTFEKARID